MTELCPLQYRAVKSKGAQVSLLRPGIPQTNSPLEHPPDSLSLGAQPDLLLHSSDQCHFCGSPQREPHAVDRSHNSRQEIRGSRGSAVSQLAAEPQLSIAAITAMAVIPAVSARRIRGPKLTAASLLTRREPLPPLSTRLPVPRRGALPVFPWWVAATPSAWPHTKFSSVPARPATDSTLGGQA